MIIVFFIPLLHLQDQQHALQKDVGGHLIIAMEVVKASSENDILDPDRAPVAVDDLSMPIKLYLDIQKTR